MSFPNFTFWSHLLAIVSVEVCCLAALGFVAQLFFRSAVWQRAVWQMAVICLLLLPASEWTGFGRGTAAFLFGHKRVVENAPTPGFTVFKSTGAGGSVTAKLQLPSLASRPAVWWPAWVWLAGMIVVLGRMAAAQVLLLALRWRREKIATHSLRERVAYVARSVGLRRKVSLLRMPKAISPMAFGILRPSIGLPPGFEAKWSATEQEAVLAHELAHLAAMDPLWFLLADCASAWLWWHPLVWWVRHSLHGAAELAADEATTMVPDGPGALANCLVSLGKEMTAARGWSWVGINGGFRSKLGKRVERLMRMSGGARRPMAGWLGAAAKLTATILIVATVVLLFGSFHSAQEQKEDAWRGQLRGSWNRSPGALLVLAAADDNAKQKAGITAWIRKAKLLYEKDKLLMLAALDDKAKLKADIASWVTNGKLLYEKGKYDDSEAVLEAVMQKDPANRSAAYYLDLIKEARYIGRAHQREADVIRSVGDLIRRLESAEKGWGWNSYTKPVRHPFPYPMSNTNLVYGRRHILSMLDSIIINESSYDLPLKDVLRKLRNESQRRDPDGIGIKFMINPRVEAGVGAPPPIDLGQVRIKISPPLRNLRLMDVLDAITKVADSPIRYTVEDYAVVFSLVSPETTSGLVLYTKTFRVDSKSFVQGLENVTGVTLNFGPQIGSGNVMRTNRMAGFHYLVVAYFAAAGADLAPPKIIFFNDRLGVLLVRATQQDLQIIQQAVELLNHTPPQVMIEARFTEVDEAALQGLALDRNKREFTGIMTDKQLRSALAVIEQHTNADVLSAPKVITESGRQAKVSCLNKDGTGVSLDILPTVGPDGYLIQITAIPAIKTGYETWQVKASRKVVDGETMVIGGVMTNQPSGATKVRVIFISPRIIDPAGNPVHTDEEISKRPGRP